MRSSALKILIILGFTVATAVSADAHEKWFHETAGYGLRSDLLLRPLPMIMIAIVVLVTIPAWLYWRKRGRGFVPGPKELGASDERRSALYGLIPAVLAVHVAVPLLVGGVQGQLFSPNNQLSGVWMYMVGLTETGLALAIFYGALTRLAAVALVILWLIGIPLVGLEPMLDSTMYLGFAGFFFLAGRGPVSIDRLVVPPLEPSREMMEKAIVALRAGIGLSLIFVAFTEKFANLPLATAFLDRYPLNFTGALGIPMSNETFILCAGSVELLVGLWILFGIFPREIILIAWIPINMTLTIFNWTELIGHLPIYGTLAILLVWSADPENMRLWLAGLREGPLPIEKPLKNTA
jgi:uncharacterized membrane protein YphA (DoxX/SURF4 family)